jgi:3-hydroxyacyl-CoA dehydrogenase
MGAGIAAAALTAGLRVTLIERDADAAGAARERVSELLDGAVERGKMDGAARDTALAGFEAVDDDARAAGADLAIEAVFEDAAVKREVFAKLSEAMGEEAILATNTSYLDPRDIFRDIPRPDRCLGLHFFSPANIMKLLEVVRTPDTGAEVLATGFALARRLGKMPVLSGICDGFIGNRILSAYRRAADYLLADGALPHEVDAAMRGFGMAMGPYEVQDMAGLQIAWANRKRQAATRPAQERYVDIADRLCEMDRLGRRSGKGWYDYGDDGKPRRSAEVEALIEAHSREHGIVRRNFAEDEITARLLAVMANEGLRILEEKIAERPGDVDVVEVHGYGFPRWRGGPMHHAAEVGWAGTRRTMHLVAEESPGSWVLASTL